MSPPALVNHERLEIEDWKFKIYNFVISNPALSLNVFSQPLPEPSRPAAPELAGRFQQVLRTIDDEPHARCIDRAVYHVHQPADIAGRAPPDRLAEVAFGGVLYPLHEGRSAGKHHP